MVDFGQHSGLFRDKTGAHGGGFASYAFTVNLYLSLSNNVFRGNHAIGATDNNVRGGGFHAEGYSWLNVTDCLVENNQAYNGGGACISWPNTRMDRTVIRNNQAGNWGGGLHAQFTLTNRDPWIRTTLIYNNTASVGGGLLALTTPRRVYLKNTTIVSNYAYNATSSGVSIQSAGASGDRGMVSWNSIIMHNHPKNLSGGSTLLAESFFTNNCTSPLTGLAGAGNIDADPKFADFEGADFRLSADSPCINAGTNQLDWMADTAELDGNPRIDRVFGLVDIGAYEYPFRGSVLLIR